MTPEVEAEAPVAVLADAHFSEETAQKLPAFKAFLDRFPHDFSTLVLLGDLFDFWVGVNGHFPFHQELVIKGIKEARQRGASIYYVEGNRDYKIDRIDGGTLFDRIIRDEGAFRISGTRLLFTHGDMINRKDWRYRIWRKVSRTLLAPLALQVLPTKSLLNLASKLEFRLRGTNAAGRRGFPRESCLAYAARCFARGFDAVIVGHFHREEEIRLDHGAPPKGFFSVPSFRETGRILVVDRDGTPAFRSSIP